MFHLQFVPQLFLGSPLNKNQPTVCCCHRIVTKKSTSSHVHAGRVAQIGAHRIGGPGIIAVAPHGFDFAAAAEPPWAHRGHGIVGIPGETRHFRILWLTANP